MDVMFQSLTGSTGHFGQNGTSQCHDPYQFQSLTGSTGHFGLYEPGLVTNSTNTVSIPNGLHRPFRHTTPNKQVEGLQEVFQSLTGSTGHFGNPYCDADTIPS